jgi:hypothetical protein
LKTTRGANLHRYNGGTKRDGLGAARILKAAWLPTPGASATMPHKRRGHRKWPKAVARRRRAVARPPCSSATRRRTRLLPMPSTSTHRAEFGPTPASDRAGVTAPQQTFTPAICAVQELPVRRSWDYVRTASIIGQLSGRKARGRCESAFLCQVLAQANSQLELHRSDRGCRRNPLHTAPRPPYLPEPDPKAGASR